MRFGEKKKTEFVPSEAAVQETETEAPVEYTSQAFSMVRHPDNNGFALITVAFNPVTMHAKVIEVKKVGENREDAEFAFKVTVGEFFANQESK